MDILVLNGSPRPNGSTKQMVEAFREGAVHAGHKVNVVDVCRKNISGCLACEYCHTKGHGSLAANRCFIGFEWLRYNRR